MANSSLRDSLFVLSQYLMPHHLQTLLVNWVTHREWRWMNRLIMPWFVKHYGVDMGIARESDWRSYPCFNALFTRSLKTDARPIDSGSNQLACPVDGTISQSGRITNGRIFQAKGHDYSLLELLGGNQEHARLFEEGSFSTIYLSPRDYHRIHMPTNACLREMTYIPGKLFSVNAATVRKVPRLFARNERVVCMFDSEFGPMAVILVGALHVGSIETVWHGQVTPPYGKKVESWNYQNLSSPITLEKGQEIARFNLGSTVIVLFPENKVQMDKNLVSEVNVVMGQLLATQTS